jgi:hypothetical protein
VRIIAVGALNKSGTVLVNSNAHAFLHPPGIEKEISLDGNRDIKTSDWDLDVNNSSSRTLSRVQ